MGQSEYVGCVLLCLQASSGAPEEITLCFGGCALLHANGEKVTNILADGDNEDDED